MKSLGWRVALGLGVVSLCGCAQVATKSSPPPATPEASATAPVRQHASVPPERIAQFLDDRMTLALGLTDQQRQQVHAINVRVGDAPKASDLKSALSPGQLNQYQTLRPDLAQRLHDWLAAQS